MEWCNQCGAEVHEGASYCVWCGAGVRSSAATGAAVEQAWGVKKSGSNKTYKRAMQLLNRRLAA